MERAHIRVTKHDSGKVTIRWIGKPDGEIMFSNELLDDKELKPSLAEVIKRYDLVQTEERAGINSKIFKRRKYL